MKANVKILIIICLLFLVGTVAAKIPDKVTITSDKTYLTANGVDQSTITVSVSNTTPGFSGPIVGAGVNFSVLDPALGTFTPIIAITDTNGKATSLFKVKTKSGFAAIRADVSYSNTTGSYNNFTLFTQKIDHDKAHDAAFSHPLESPVGTNVSFNISFTDRYGNPIDQIINPGQQHTINLHVHGSTPDDCGFVGYRHDILSLPLDINGNASVMVHLSSGAGPNSVTMEPFEEITTPVPRIITSISTEPFYIEQNFNPDFPPQVPADNEKKFSIIYTVLDKFRNPASQQWVWVNTSVAGEETLFKSDTLGHISISYGPRSTIGIINITATAVNNKTITVSHEVEFTSTAATTMVLTANPEFMPSRDVDPLIKSFITATVTDIMGNPVDNETVTFSLGAGDYPGGPYNVTSLPSLPITSAITDANGHATVQFIPGSFSTNSSNVSYSATATGTCTITALWNTNPKNVLVTWKNYPYLSVQTAVNPQTVEVNKTVDVTISLKADGWAMQPKPIDVDLIIDNSNSMAWDTPSRISQATTAANSFVNTLNSTRDQAGLVSFGSSTTLAQSLTNNFPAVKTKIGALSGNGGATQLRKATYTAIKDLKTNARSSAVKAVILVTDGEWNKDGNPLGIGYGFDGSTADWPGNAVSFSAYQYYSDLGGGSYKKSLVPVPNGGSYWDATRGVDVASTTDSNEWHYENAENSEQNLSVYAKKNGIRIYAITFAHKPVSGCTGALDIMAKSTGGFYAHAPDGTALSQIYANISGELNDTAGVNTAMVTDFKNVNVTGFSVPGADVYDYVPNSTTSTKILWQDGVTNVTNQSANWAADKKLDFTIGTMKVGQTWVATFRLKAKKSGSIDVFGTNSALFFNNGSETLTLPHTFLTVVPNPNTTGFAHQTIDVSSSCPVQAQQTFILPITWTTTYTGPAGTISDEVIYISETGAHVPFYQGSYPVNGDTIITRSAQFDMRTVAQGNYAIQVFTKAGLAAATSQSCGNYTFSKKNVKYIKLE
jgi:hypothetical protein